MKFHRSIPTTLMLVLTILPTLRAEEEPGPEIAGLQKAAADFVIAYNNKDAAAIAKLFTQDGEMTDLTAADLTSGREQIQARYEEIFSQKALQIAIEVDSVRLVAPGLAIEDGTYHLTPADDETASPISTSYTAVLAKDDGGAWRIASTRSLEDVTEAAGHLAKLADTLKGEWTHRDPDGVRLDLAFGWDATGTNISGEMLTTTSDSEPQEGSIRISWDAAKQQIVSWMFDANGGFTHGVWTPTDEGWLIRSEGNTADGETLTACQQLTTEGSETLIWAATHRIVDGENVPDKTLRIVRQAPEPIED
jgi:uncharacterized protein (TIGR02246 family)